MKVPGCPLCDAPGGAVVFEAGGFRVIRASEAGFPAFWRLVWTCHVAEFSDLEPGKRALCIEALVIIERVLRNELAPTKVNLASLGNAVPHLHWHVIARFDWDSHYPAPVWAAPVRELDMPRIAALDARCGEVDQALAQALEPLRGDCTAS